MIEIITEADYKDRLAATQNGVLLFFRSSARIAEHGEGARSSEPPNPASRCTASIEENAAAAAALGAEPPTIFVVSRAVRSGTRSASNPRRNGHVLRR
ncbi:MAG: thioredoxin [Bilophila wadsworthia]